MEIEWADFVLGLAEGSDDGLRSGICIRRCIRQRGGCARGLANRAGTACGRLPRCRFGNAAREGHAAGGSHASSSRAGTKNAIRHPLDRGARSAGGTHGGGATRASPWHRRRTHPEPVETGSSRSWPPAIRGGLAMRRSIVSWCPNPVKKCARLGAWAPSVEREVSILAASRSPPPDLDRVQARIPGGRSDAGLGSGPSGSAAARPTRGQTACQGSASCGTHRLRRLSGNRRAETATLGGVWAPSLETCRCRPVGPVRVLGK